MHFDNILLSKHSQLLAGTVTVWAKAIVSISIITCVVCSVGCTLAWAEGTIKIAAIFPQTGKAKAYGRAALEGAHIAVEKINTSGGISGRALKLIVIDNKSSPLYARHAAQRAIEMNVSSVIGAAWSTQSLAMAPVLQKAGIPMISPTATAPEVTLVGSYIFRACYTDSFQGRLMAGFAYHSLGARSAAVLTNLSETYSQALASQFSQVFRKIGGKVLVEEGYVGSAVDFRKILLPLKTKYPDVIFVPGYTRDSGLIIRQAHTMSITTRSKFIGGDAWEKDINNYAGAGLEGSYFSTFWHPHVSSRESRYFTKAYHAYYGDKEISPYAAQAFDAVLLFADAARRAKSIKPNDIQQALMATKGLQGATGILSFDDNGDPLNKGATILNFSLGQWKFHKWIEASTWEKTNER